MIGGGQEGGLRSGTENVFGIKVFEYATKTHLETLKTDYNRALELKKEFLNGLYLNRFTIISSETSSPYVICLSANGLKGEVLQHMLENDGVIIGTGSACSSKSPHSRMLKSIGYESSVLDGVIRISFSFETTINEVKTLTSLLNEKVEIILKTMNL